MSRPPLEVADLIRAAGTAFIERNRHWLRWKHVKVLLAIARCRTAALGGHLDECTRCGHRRHLLQLLPQPPLPEVSDRCPRPLDRRASARNFSRPATSMWSSHFPVSWHHWLCRTRRSSTICCSAPVRKLFSKSLAIPDTSARKSVSSACCTPGIRSSAFTRMSIASFPPAGCHSITPTGSNRAKPSFFPSRCSPRLSRQVRAGLKQAFQRRPTPLPRRSHAPRSAEDLRRLATTTVPKGLGGLLETPLRRPRICAPISGPLHPSRGHLQPSPGLAC